MRRTTRDALRRVAIASSNLDLSAQFGWQKSGHDGCVLAGLLDEIGNAKRKVDGEGQEAGAH